MAFTVAIIGRPNVGKSTLFNRLVGKRLALVDDRPGVTRDRREGEAILFGLSFTAIDTAGLEDAKEESLEGRMRVQTEQAVTAADATLLVVDARAGITPIDEHFARWLRRTHKPVILVANKCEGRGGSAGLYEAYKLGLGEPVPLSAEHGEGLYDLYEALLSLAPPEAVAAEPVTLPEDEGEGESEEDEEEPKELQMAVVGRPNVGKSTLINRLLGEDRLLTGPEAGITRDSISVHWQYQGRPFRLIDTAGLRRRAQISDKLEKLSVADTLRSVQFAHVAVLVLDAALGLEKQDLTIARMVADEGRALVIALNKWDMVEDRAAVIQRLRDRIETSLPQVKGVPFVTLSSQSGEGLSKLLPAVLAAYEVWNRRIPTAPLNRWLAAATGAHPPPLVAGRRQKLRYATQAKARPPTFILFATKPEELPDSYQRYLVNGLREEFDLPGVPIRLRFRKGKNPYAPS